MNREPLTEPELQKVASKACATAIQFQSFITADETPDELVCMLRNWWLKESSKFFKCEVQAQDAEDVDQSLDPDMVEVTEELTEPPEQD